MLIHENSKRALITSATRSILALKSSTLAIEADSHTAHWTPSPPPILKIP